MKVNYQRSENLKKKRKVGKLSTFMVLDRHSFRYLKQLENSKFNDALKHYRYDILPIPKKYLVGFLV